MATLRRLGAISSPTATRPLIAAIPERATAALRLGEGDAWLEVTPVGMRDDARGVVDDGATVYAAAAPDLDLVYVRDAARVEELRLAKTKAAAAYAAWNLRKGPAIATLQIVDGRIEAVDTRGIVRVQSEPAFAIDANGVRRALQLSLHGSTVEARLDVEGLATPIAIDPAWVAAAAPSGLARLDAPLVLLSSGKVLLSGGSVMTTGTQYSTGEVYDPATNTWTATANNMAGPRSEHTATRVGASKVVIVGGSGDRTLSTAEVYDETTNSFGALQILPVTSAGPAGPNGERRAHAAVRLATGEVLVLGGRESTYHLDTMFVVSTSGTVASTVMTTRLPDAVGNPNAVLMPDGTVLVAAGESQDFSGGARFLRSAFSITVSGGTAIVRPLADLPVARLRAIPLIAPVGPHAGRAMFIGGAIASTTSEKTLVTSQGGVIYDAAANKWLPVPLMATKRFLGAGGLIPGGRVLVSGGANDIVITGTANQDAEVLDLSTMTWKWAGKMLEPRAGHMAQVLNDGSVLLVGGVSAISDGFVTLTTGAERFTMQAIAAACAADGECTSGFCADGICCDKACKGQCEACNATGSAGTCKPITGEPRGAREKCKLDLTADPACGLSCDGVDATACKYPGSAATCSTDACAAGRETHASTCDGAGKCKDVARACGDYTCATTTCKITCAAKADCVNAAHFCEAGKCIPQQASGSPCTRDEACATGICVDGTCCESKCDGQCQACDVPGQAGKCVPIKGKPHGTRADCEKDSADACKSKSCDGTNTAACAGTVGPCSNYACDDTAKVCKTVCATNADCGAGFECDSSNGTCVPRTSRCIGNAEFQAADGSKTKCNAYVCQSGACLDKCTSTNDCQNGFVCDGAGACVATATAAAGDESGGCSMGTRGSPAWAAIALLIGLARRRRTR